MANEALRAAAKKNGVRMWEVGEYFGISEFTITRKLRRELVGDEREKFLEAIEKIAKTKKAG